MKISELKKILKKGGCYKIGEGGRHEKWFSPITNTVVAVGRHNEKDIPTGMADSILKKAGLKRLR